MSIYLDNNATTMMSANTVREMLRWVNRGNPSASYASARECREMMVDCRAQLLRELGCSSEREYGVYFTSGATEANCTILRSVIDARLCASEGPVHIVSSAIEHKSILLLLQSMANHNKRVRISLVIPGADGAVAAETALSAIRPETCLVSIMFANNETGAINPVARIGEGIMALCRAGHSGIFFHSDIVQAFGKIPVNMRAAGIDGCSISFHKIHGPPGIGAMVVRRSMINVLGLCPIIHGTQNEGFRGGTENILGIGAARAAILEAREERDVVADKQRRLKKHLIDLLRSRAPTRTLEEYLAARRKYELEIVLLSDESSKYLPGTIMLSAAKHLGPGACNKLIKEALEKAGIIVSVGSACNTSSEQHSHVLQAMRASEAVMDGAIRVSMGRDTTRGDLEKFADVFLAEAVRQLEITKKKGGQRSANLIGYYAK